MKKQTTITIDEELLDKSKNYIPNLSAFIEECLRKYLGEGKHQVPTNRMHELVTTISKCQLELHIMNEKAKIEEHNEEVEKNKINYAWRQLYAEYRDTRTINQDKLSHAVEVLSVPEDELVDIIEVLFAFQNETNIDVTEWTEVYNEYGGND